MGSGNEIGGRGECLKTDPEGWERGIECILEGVDIADMKLGDLELRRK